MTQWQIYTTRIGAWDARGLGLGGWSLNVQHAYDPADGMLYLGDGERRSATDMSNVINRVAGDGSSYYNCGPYNGDGILATQANLCLPQGPVTGGYVAVGPDGSLYIADEGHERVRKVGPDGIISTVAGNGTAGFSGDGGPATQAQLNGPTGVALGPDGSLYVIDFWNWRIRRVGPGGIITTVAGNGTQGYGADGIPATQTELDQPNDIVVGPDGSLYITAPDGAVYDTGYGFFTISNSTSGKWKVQVRVGGGEGTQYAMAAGTAHVYSCMLPLVMRTH